ncbi:caffeoyl-CoA O-methyltransferase-like [Telopea speciosissima]|uniref:caffeoyl-CoA O-methyltransferase-like n=1 Tax=Telopea speciosissima TaxID=54955 RepID=UPI001CC57859|nr:caffeoyl-CoA O-methyltransferase-like [Telopea speciosissima]
MDVNRENFELGLPEYSKGWNGTFDFIFVDVDKDNYLNYHKRLIDSVNVRGVIGYENIRWDGLVVALSDALFRKCKVFVLQRFRDGAQQDPCCRSKDRDLPTPRRRWNHHLPSYQLMRHDKRAD